MYVLFSVNLEGESNPFLSPQRWSLTRRRVFIFKSAVDASRLYIRVADAERGNRTTCANLQTSLGLVTYDGHPALDNLTKNPFWRTIYELIDAHTSLCILSRNERPCLTAVGSNLRIVPRSVKVAQFLNSQTRHLVGCWSRSHCRCVTVTD